VGTGKTKKISDELIGRDEKVCSCSVRIAELLGAGKDETTAEVVSPAQVLAALRQKKDGQPAE